MLLKNRTRLRLASQQLRLHDLGPREARRVDPSRGRLLLLLPLRPATSVQHLTLDQEARCFYAGRAGENFLDPTGAPFCTKGQFKTQNSCSMVSEDEYRSASTQEQFTAPTLHWGHAAHPTPTGCGETQQRCPTPHPPAGFRQSAPGARALDAGAEPGGRSRSA